MSRNQQSSGVTGEVVAPSRRDDRSGLLDIRALSSIIDARAGGGASASSVALPSFGASWALQDVSTAVPEPRAREHARAVPGTGPNTVVVGPDHRPLYVMIAALSVAVASLGAYVLMRPPPSVVVERTAAVVGGAGVDGEAPEDDADAEAKAAAEAEAKAKADAEAEAARAAADAPADPSAEAKTDAASEAVAVRGRVPRSGKPSHSIPKTTPKVDPKPTPKDASTISVECVIDPSKCDRKGKAKPRVDEGSNDPSPTDSKALPSAPSSTQIRDAMAPVKPSAKACAARHGGKAGDKVRVKLSVSGSTGKVTSALALDDYAGTPLGKCVADALGKAELPKFAKPTAGIVYAVTL